MKKILLLSLILLIVEGISAQNDYNFVGAGARQAGMGYAFIGVADDATALSSNPSGLSQLRKAEVSVVGKLTQIKYTENHTPSDDYNYDHNNTNGSLNFASIALPLRFGERKFVLGVSYQNQIDRTESSSNKFVFPTYTRINSFDQNTKISTINVGGAFKLSSWFSLGLAVNKWLSTGNSENSTKNIQNNILYLNENKNQESYNGLNYAVGVLFNFEELSNKFPLRLGVKYSSSFDLKNDRKYTKGLSNYDMPTSSYTMDVSASHDVSVTFQYPVMIGTGLSYKIGDYFTIACDYETRQFKDKNIIVETYKNIVTTPTAITFEGDTTTMHTIVPTNKNINQIRIGIEYILHPKFALIPLRMGFKTNPTPAADMKGSVAVQQSIGRSYCFGLGLVLQRLSFDLAYENYSFGFYNENTSGTSKVDIKYTYNYFTFSTIYYFK